VVFGHSAVAVGTDIYIMGGSNTVVPSTRSLVISVISDKEKSDRLKRLYIFLSKFPSMKI